jgi:hypothetical protein
VPPALVAWQVKTKLPSVLTMEGPQPLESPTGDSPSETFQLTDTSPWNQPFACPAADPRLGVTPGGVPSSACATALSAKTKPAPQSVSGTPAADVQSFALAGFDMIAYSSFTDIAGLAWRSSTAMPAALGVAALVPKNGFRPELGTVV